MQPSESERTLITLARSGNKEALVDLIMAKKDEYFRLSYSYMGNKDDALDALQDMVIILYRNIGQLKDSSAFSSWSKTILVNCCKSILQKKKKTVSLDEMIMNVGEGVFMCYQDKTSFCNIKSDITSAIMRLSSKLQEIVRLRYFLDYDYETIAQILRIPVGTVKSRLSTSVKRLKSLIGGDYIEL